MEEAVPKTKWQALIALRFKEKQNCVLEKVDRAYNSCFHGKEGLKRQRDLRTLHAVASLTTFAFMITATERTF